MQTQPASYYWTTSEKLSMYSMKPIHTLNREMRSSLGGPDRHGGDLIHLLRRGASSGECHICVLPLAVTHSCIPHDDVGIDDYDGTTCFVTLKGGTDRCQAELRFDGLAQARSKSHSLPHCLNGTILYTAGIDEPNVLLSSRMYSKITKL